MALTPTALIAVTGMMNGGGFGVNSTMTSMMGAVTSNPLISNATALLAASIDLGSLPAFIKQAGTTASAATTQAAKMLPSAGSMMGNKNLLQSFSGASSFGSASAEYSAALSELGNKSFADLGVGVKNFNGVLSGGVNRLIPAAGAGLSALAAQAKKSAFGSLSSIVPVDDNLAGALVLNDGLKSIGSSLKNFGSAYDFTNLSTLGTPAGLVITLQNQNLAGRYGINDAIVAAGFDPTNINAIPPNVLKSILSQIKGDDLNNIVTTLGAKPLSPLSNLGDMLLLDKFMPAGAMTAMGLSGESGMTNLGNSLSNLGIQADNMKMGDMLASIENKSSSHLSQVKELIPTSVKDALAPLLGTGSGPFGNPTMSDMIGSVAGEVHTDSFKTIKDATKNIMNSPIGQNLNTAMGAMAAAVESEDPVAIAEAQGTLDTAISTFNAQVAGNSELNKVATAANSAVTNSANHLAKETSNLILAGVALPSGGIAVNLGSSLTPFLSFGTKIHDFGVDKLQVGYGKMLGGVATDDLTGDALQATLAEGRNLSRTSLVGKPPAAIADQAATTAAALQSKLPDLTTAATDAKQVFAAANAVVAANPTSADAQLDLTHATEVFDQKKAAVIAAVSIISPLDIQAFANTPDAELTYAGYITTMWDKVNAERIRRGLSSLTTTRPTEA